jgi:rhodanese-related sulfurtransferase
MTILLAAFDDRHAAQLAVHQLAATGIPRDDIRIEHNLERLQAAGRPVTHESLLQSIGRMFADLVRTNIDHHQLDLVTEAIERGATVLVARAGAGQADRAAQVLKDAGAFNVGVQGGAAQAH